MNIPIKVLTSLALVAAGFFPAPAFGVGADVFIFEVVAAGFGEFAVISVGVSIALASTSWGSGDEDFVPGLVAAYAIFSAYPLAAAGGAYLVGENVAAPSENKGAAFGITVLSAYGQTLALAGTAALVDAASGDIDEGAYTKALITDILTKPLLVTYVYNKAKKPAQTPAESRGPTLEPYVAVTTAGNGAPVPVYGVTLSF